MKNKENYEQKGIRVFLYRLIDEKRFYYTPDELYVEDREQAAYEDFKDADEFNTYLETNLEQLIKQHGEDIRFEKHKRFVREKKKQQLKW